LLHSLKSRTLYTSDDMAITFIYQTIARTPSAVVAC
jgi:hypothetical protein